MTTEHEVVSSADGLAPFLSVWDGPVGPGDIAWLRDDAGRGITLHGQNDLAFLRNLASPYRLSVSGHWSDDSGTRWATTATDLSVLTSRRSRLALPASDSVRGLQVDHRPGLEAVEGLPQLDALAVYRCGPEAPTLIAHASERITRLHVGASRGRRMDLSPLAKFTALKSLELVAIEPESLEWLSGLRTLGDILINLDGLSPSRPLNLNALAGMPDLRQVVLACDSRMSRVEVLSLEPLLALPNLEYVYVGTPGRVSDGSELAVYAALRERGVRLGTRGGQIA
jgi:hypothetical protein